MCLETNEHYAHCDVGPRITVEPFRDDARGAFRDPMTVEEHACGRQACLAQLPEIPRGGEADALGMLKHDFKECRVHECCLVRTYVSPCDRAVAENAAEEGAGDPLASLAGYTKCPNLWARHKYYFLAESEGRADKGRDGGEEDGADGSASSSPPPPVYPDEVLYTRNLHTDEEYRQMAALRAIFFRAARHLALEKERLVGNREELLTYIEPLDAALKATPLAQRNKAFFGDLRLSVDELRPLLRIAHNRLMLLVTITHETTAALDGLVRLVQPSGGGAAVPGFKLLRSRREDEVLWRELDHILETRSGVLKDVCGASEVSKELSEMLKAQLGTTDVDSDYDE